MNEWEKLLHNIKGLRQSIAVASRDLATLELPLEDRLAIREDIEALTADLNEQLEKLNRSQG